MWLPKESRLQGVSWCDCGDIFFIPFFFFFGNLSGFGTDARFNTPSGLAIDKSGNEKKRKFLQKSKYFFFFFDMLSKIFSNCSQTKQIGLIVVADITNNGIRLIDPKTCEVKTMTRCPSGDQYCFCHGYISRDFCQHESRFGWAYGIAVDPLTGDLIISDSDFHFIRRISGTGLRG